MIALSFQTRFFPIVKDVEATARIVEAINEQLLVLRKDARAVNTRLYLDELEIKLSGGEGGTLPLQVHLTAHQEKNTEQEKGSAKGCGCKG